MTYLIGILGRVLSVNPGHVSRLKDTEGSTIERLQAYHNRIVGILSIYGDVGRHEANSTMTMMHTSTVLARTLEFDKNPRLDYTLGRIRYLN